ncbi:efflux RND transporter permease subunit [Fervidibacillus albus]|uniref:MMPL family transporter n=1 Tax=Fervidibacillus albus TaxID=2980026 RepID=A0A9E8LV39_9BACI|nr:MMPL family transporter [Fervidibacillus albus]WAA10144.1 MMPL family transporter [Fervidibacillus albus]
MEIDLSTLIIRYRKWIVICFFLFALIGALAQTTVQVNYNLVDYLPPDAPSTVAMDISEQQFTDSVPNATVMIRDVSIVEGLDYQSKLEALEGVSGVTWLDDVLDVKIPLEMAEQGVVDSYYRDRNALLFLRIEQGKEAKVLDRIYGIIGEENAVAGEAVNTAIAQKMAFKETMFATAILIPIILIILLLSTQSWIEPLFFLTTIGISILINFGTNIFLGDISFITQSIAPILQLAVSLDYAIFLLHSFSEHRKTAFNPEKAMKLAIKESFPSIAASASTTFFGFFALTFMNFGIGADLGLNLVKGIFFSFISVVLFLPAFTLTFYRWIDRTKHRTLVPNFKTFGTRIYKLGKPMLLLILLVIIPAFFAQSRTTFLYGVNDQPEYTRAGRDQMEIESVFGKQTPVVLMVPKGDIAKEEALVSAIEEHPEVTGIDSYVKLIGSAIPLEFIDSNVTAHYYSDQLARIIIHSETDVESKETFSFLDDIKRIVHTYYDETYLLGESVSLYDIKHTVERDHRIVNFLTVTAIAIVLLITFRTVSIPVILLFTIQSSVWLNLAVPYFMNTSIMYLGYLLINTIQLAATVDYGILFSETYRTKRRTMSAKQAVIQTTNEKFIAIFISASILSTVGFVLWLTSSNPIVSSVGLLIGRGAFLAFTMVVIVLPTIFVIFDRYIERTTRKENFYKES